MQFVLLHQDFYQSVDVDRLNDVNRQLANQLNEIQRAATRCAHKATQCEFPAIAIPEIEIPKRKSQTLSESPTQEEEGIDLSRYYDRMMERQRHGISIKRPKLHLPE